MIQSWATIFEDSTVRRKPEKNLPEKPGGGKRIRQEIWVGTMAQALNSPSYEPTQGTISWKTNALKIKWNKMNSIYIYKKRELKRRVGLEWNPTWYTSLIWPSLNWASPSPHCPRAAEILHLRLFRIHSNGRSSFGFQEIEACLL